MEIIDTGYGLELLQEGEWLFVRLEDDHTALCSLTLAEHEQSVENLDGEWIDFDRVQVAQISDWFEEHEA